MVHSSEARWGPPADGRTLTFYWNWTQIEYHILYGTSHRYVVWHWLFSIMEIFKHQYTTNDRNCATKILIVEAWRAFLRPRNTVLCSKLTLNNAYATASHHGCCNRKLFRWTYRVVGGYDHEVFWLQWGYRRTCWFRLIVRGCSGCWLFPSPKRQVSQG